MDLDLKIIYFTYQMLCQIKLEYQGVSGHPQDIAALFVMLHCLMLLLFLGNG